MPRGEGGPASAISLFSLVGRGVARRGRRLRARLRAWIQATRIRREIGRIDARLESEFPTTLSIVAHADDDLLFRSTQLARDAAVGRGVATLVVTAGDDGDGEWYWRAREAGMREAYASLAGVPNAWDDGLVRLGDHDVALVALREAPQWRILFLRLPDGGLDGTGSARWEGASLRRLAAGEISTLSPLDGGAPLTLDSLAGVIAAAVAVCGPDRIDTLDYTGEFDDGDHSDHHAVAQLARSASAAFDGSHVFTGYLGYPIAERAANLREDEVRLKEQAFLAYARSDHKTGRTLDECSTRPEGAWLTREYRVGEPRDPS